MQVNRAVTVLAPALALALVLGGAACGGQGDDVSDPGTEAAADESADPSGTSTAPPTTGPSLSADDIPVPNTPAGGWHGTMPAPILAGCTEPLVDGAPELGGLWQIVEVESGGAVVPDHRALGKVQRIEQCGDRLVVTAGGIIHDMRVDGTEENGVHDVAGYTDVEVFGPPAVTDAVGSGKRIARGGRMVFTYSSMLSQSARTQLLPAVLMASSRRGCWSRPTVCAWRWSIRNSA